MDFVNRENKNDDPGLRRRLNRISTCPSGPLQRLAALAAIVSTVTLASATPQFARETGLPCSSCHTYVPRLNRFGQKFYTNGLRLAGQEKARTLPLRGQVTATATTPPNGGPLPIGWSDIALASGGNIGRGITLYRMKWFPIAQSVQMYGIHAFDKRWVMSAGRLAMISQVDPELRLNLSVPVALSPRRDGGATPFSPFGDALALRVVGSSESAMPYGDGWKVAATVPFSNEIGPNAAPDRLRETSSTPKGVFVEAYRRLGLDSFGVNAFFGRDGRSYQGLVLQREVGSLYVEGSVGHSNTRDGSTTAYSLGFDTAYRSGAAFGLRVDSQSETTSLVALASQILGGKESLWQFIMEGRVQDGARPGAILRLKFRF